MSNIAIRVENLGKIYHIGGPQAQYKTLRNVLTETFSAPVRRARDLLHGQASGASGLKKEIWALKDVSFEVKHGEVVGIIGHNGAGKSTLLKILSRITEPTTGYADIYGRIGALLEVGTGFHPELTGRENVYLSGAILGMSRHDMDRKFDEIVDFAGVEKFIDTPVKHFSTGMSLRLGFAVAAHLEPEILVIDEVLAVGDAAFQKKCLGRMSKVAGEGRTVLFVSHNMGAIRTLCDNTIALAKGQVTMAGSTNSVIDAYLHELVTITDGSIYDGKRFYRVQATCNPENLDGGVLLPLKPATFVVECYGKEPILSPSVYLGVHTSDAQLLFGFDFQDFQLVNRIEANQKVVFEFHINELPLMPGTYFFRIHLKDLGDGSIEVVDRDYEFQVSPGPIHNASVRYLPPQWFGNIVVPISTQVKFQNPSQFSIV